MRKLRVFFLLPLMFSGCAWIKTHPEFEKDLEIVSEEIVKDVVEVAL